MSYRIIRKRTYYITRFYRNGREIPEMDCEWGTEAKAEWWGKMISGA